MARAKGNGVVGMAGIRECRGVMGDALGAGAITGSVRDVPGVDGPARDAPVVLCVDVAGAGADVDTGNKAGTGIRGSDGPIEGVAGGVLDVSLSLCRRYSPNRTHCKRIQHRVFIKL